jgi:mannose-6-phosphate isomerase
VETQQQSDTTYRLYDYGRPRELHLREGLAAVKEVVGSGKVRRSMAATAQNGFEREELVAAPYFVVEKFNLSEPTALRTLDDSGVRSVQILVGLQGSGTIVARGAEPVTFATGDAVVVPAGTWNFEVRPQRGVEFIMAHVPGKPLPEPETTR